MGGIRFAKIVEAIGGGGGGGGGASFRIHDAGWDSREKEEEGKKAKYRPIVLLPPVSQNVGYVMPASKQGGGDSPIFSTKL